MARLIGWPPFFEAAQSKGEEFVKALIELKRIIAIRRSGKTITWAMVAEDLGYSVDSLDSRIYRHEHPNTLKPAPIEHLSRRNDDSNGETDEKKEQSEQTDTFTATEKEMMYGGAETEEDEDVTNAFNEDEDEQKEETAPAPDKKESDMQQAPASKAGWHNRASTERIDAAYSKILPIFKFILNPTQLEQELSALTAKVREEVAFSVKNYGPKTGLGKQNIYRTTF